MNRNQIGQKKKSELFVAWDDVLTEIENKVKTVLEAINKYDDE